MGILDVPLRNVTKTVIGTFGKSVTFRLVSPGTYNTTTGTQKPTDNDTAIKGVLAEYANHERGDNIALGDRKLFVAASDLTVIPKTDDQVLIGSSVYRIVRNNVTFATDEAALHELQIRGGTE